MSLEEKNYYLAISLFPGIGSLRFNLLKNYFKSAKNIWKASEKDLLKVGLGQQLSSKFLKFRSDFSLENYLQKLSRLKIKFITLAESSYPKLLKEIPDPPIVIYIRGELKNINFSSPFIAVVGTRKVTSYGREVTKKIVRELVQVGFVIVSGLAYGVDTTAHQTAIDCGGRTIAVLGGGIDVIYPRSNTSLYWRIIKDSGLVISEYPPATGVQRGFFPARNRIISGLSLGTVVTQGAVRSGSLITARLAAEQGREVFAIPGDITSYFSKAPTYLLKQGAKLVTGIEDILEEIKIKTKNEKPKMKNTDKKLKNVKDEYEIQIVKLLKKENLTFNEISRKTKIDAKKLGSILTNLGIKKAIKKLNSNVYALC